MTTISQAYAELRRAASHFQSLPEESRTALSLAAAAVALPILGTLGGVTAAFVGAVNGSSSTFWIGAGTALASSALGLLEEEIASRMNIPDTLREIWSPQREERQPLV